MLKDTDTVLKRNSLPETAENVKYQIQSHCDGLGVIVPYQCGSRKATPWNYVCHMLDYIYAHLYNGFYGGVVFHDLSQRLDHIELKLVHALSQSQNSAK